MTEVHSTPSPLDRAGAAAGVPPRAATAPYQLAVLDAEALEKLSPAQWDGLARDALVENPYYSRQHVLAGLETIDADIDIQALTVRTPDAKLVGLFVFTRHPCSMMVPKRVALGHTNLYQVASTPLVAKRHARGVIAAWLDAMDSDPEIPGIWVLPHTELRSAFAQICMQLALARDVAALTARSYERPCLTRIEGGLEAHRDAVIGKKRVKDITRNLRRLGELGELRYERAVDPIWVQARIEDFLALEHAGWKGEENTAFLSDPDHAEFARRAYGGTPGAQGLASVDSLLLDGKPIAMSINIATGGTAFTPKCAYDESYRKYGPGLILEYLVIEAFYKSGRETDMDSSVTTDGHIVSSLWNAHKPMGTLIVGPAGLQTQLVAGMEEQTHRAKALAKRLLGKG